MAKEPDEELDYTGLHAFIFVDHIESDPQDPERTIPRLMKEIRKLKTENGAVLAAHEFVGPFLAFVHVRAKDDDLAGLQRLIFEDLWSKGVRCTHAVEGPTYVSSTGKPMGAKRKDCDVVAMVRIWVERGEARDVLGRLGGELGTVFHGASIVYGGFDILLTLDGEDVDAVTQAVLDKLQRIPGIVRTETALADYR